MSKKDSIRFDGEYVDGVYQSSYGYATSGLNCPKGVRLYDHTKTPAIFYQPDDTAKGEEFELITREAAPGILPYYAVSNFGRVMNVHSGNIMRYDVSRTGYCRYSLAADTKSGMRKYNAHRLVLGTFNPVDGMENLQVNHMNMVKSDNYVNRPNENGELETNLEWCTAKENVRHRVANTTRLTMERAKRLRELHDSGYSYSMICDMEENSDIGYNTIKYACENKTFVDPDYTPKCVNKIVQRKTGPKGLTEDDVRMIRRLYNSGFTQVEIQEKFYPVVTVGTISNIVTRKTYANVT